MSSARHVRGNELRLVARDTHSEVARSRRGPDELVAEGAAILLRPESPEIAEEIGGYPRRTRRAVSFAAVSDGL